MIKIILQDTLQQVHAAMKAGAEAASKHEEAQAKRYAEMQQAATDYRTWWLQAHAIATQLKGLIDAYGSEQLKVSAAKLFEGAKRPEDDKHQPQVG